MRALAAVELRATCPGSRLPVKVDIQVDRTKKDSIGIMGSYTLDSHFQERVALPDGTVTIEGNIEVTSLHAHIGASSLNLGGPECDRRYSLRNLAAASLRTRANSNQRPLPCQATPKL